MLDTPHLLVDIFRLKWLLYSLIHIYFDIIQSAINPYLFSQPYTGRFMKPASKKIAAIVKLLQQGDTLPVEQLRKLGLIYSAYRLLVSAFFY